MAANESILRRLDDSGLPLLVTRLVLGGLFVYTGWEKVGHPFDFLKQIHLYDALPESPGIYLNSVVIVLPWLEIVAGTALIFGAYVRGAAATLALMLAAFTPAIFIRAMAIRASEGTPFMEIAFDCGCGTGEVIIWKKLLVNGGWLLLSLYALFSQSRRFCVGAWFARGSGARANAPSVASGTPGGVT